jgi:hypothetical protein
MHPLPVCIRNGCSDSLQHTMRNKHTPKNTASQKNSHHRYTAAQEALQMRGPAGADSRRCIGVHPQPQHSGCVHKLCMLPPNHQNDPAKKGTTRTPQHAPRNIQSLCPGHKHAGAFVLVWPPTPFLLRVGRTTELAQHGQSMHTYIRGEGCRR